MFVIICCFGSVFSWLNAPIQAFLRPALWIPGLRSFHRKKERWQWKEDPECTFRRVREALAVLEMRFYEHYGYRNIKVAKVDAEKLFIRAYFLTPCMQWLDVVELQFECGEHSGTSVKAHSFSSGVLPVCIPFAFLLNMVRMDVFTA